MFTWCCQQFSLQSKANVIVTLESVNINKSEGHLHVWPWKKSHIFICVFLSVLLLKVPSSYVHDATAPVMQTLFIRVWVERECEDSMAYQSSPAAKEETEVILRSPAIPSRSELHWAHIPEEEIEKVAEAPLLFITLYIQKSSIIWWHEQLKIFCLGHVIFNTTAI